MQALSIFTNPAESFPRLTKEKLEKRKRVMKEYLSLMEDALLAGYEWEMPGNFGSLRVEKKEQTRVPVHRIPKNGKLEKVSKLNRLGYSYQLTFIAGPGHSMKDYNFETADSFRKKLTSILMNTQKEFPFYDKC